MKSRRRRPHAQIHLPPLTVQQAYLLTTIFDRASDAIWRAHGDAMTDFQGHAFSDEPLSFGAVATANRDPDDDSDLF